MKPKTTGLRVFTLLLLLSCGADNPKDEVVTKATAENTAASTGESQHGGLIGEWEQQYTCFDKNGNYQLEPEEKVPSNIRTGFDWFSFNADGSCLRDKDMKFKSTYEVQEKGNTKKLMIQNVHGYTITELTDTELVLGAEGAFIVFKKIR